VEALRRRAAELAKASGAGTREGKDAGEAADEHGVTDRRDARDDDRADASRETTAAKKRDKLQETLEIVILVVPAPPSKAPGTQQER
jgi:hypothetical protein